jgi:putative endonuclease
LLTARSRLGRAGEQLAAEHLRSLGYEITARNFRTRSGEIDLVAVRDGGVLLIEVKTRAGTSHGLPIEAIDARKRRAMAAAALEWRRATAWRGRLRVAAVTITLEVIADALD